MVSTTVAGGAEGRAGGGAGVGAGIGAQESEAEIAAAAAAKDVHLAAHECPEARGPAGRITPPPPA